MLTYSNLKPWTLPNNYAGKHWGDYFSAGVGQSRDSDALERSNFRCMLDALGGGSDTVIVVHEGHWAVGWVEWIAIHKADAERLEIANRIKGKLADYPVINEDDWSEEESAEADSVWRDCYSPQDRIAYIRENSSQFDFRDFADMLGCVRGQYFAGYASELLG